MNRTRTISKSLPGKDAVQYTNLQKLQNKMKWMEKERKVAWAKYYHELENNQNRQIITYERLVQVPVEAMSDYAVEEYRKLLRELKKEIDCPICLEVIPPDQVDMTACGHKFCKSCLGELKKTPAPKCAICRNKIWVKKTR